jgi:tRNA A-37 threonylcarbamoyl transferase component Bud32
MSVAAMNEVAVSGLEPLLRAIADGDHRSPLPPRLAWPDDRVLKLGAMLRLLPGKRAVLAAELDGRPVLVKLFLPSGQRQAERELAGHRKLTAAGIATPALLEQREFDGATALVYEYLAAAAPVAAPGLLPAAPLLRALLDQLAAGYRAGLYQRDLHWGNFLVADGRLYAIDVGDIGGEPGRPLPQQTIVANLGLLAAQCRRGDQRALLAAIECHPVMKLLDANAAADLAAAAASCWQERKRRVLEKCFRDTSAVYYRREFRRAYAARRDRLGPDLQAFFDDPDAVLERGQRLKSGNSATVAKVLLDGRWVVIKRYNMKSLTHRLRRCARPSRAWVSWRSAHLLELVGIATPAPVAFLERRFGPLRAAAYYICDWVDAVELTALLAAADPDAAQRERIGALFRNLRLGQLHHGDLKAKNLLMDAGDLYLIDLDALAEVPSPARFRQLHRRDRQRFLRNWDDRPALRQRLAKEIAQYE